MQTNHFLTVHTLYTSELAKKLFAQLKKIDKTICSNVSEPSHWRFTRASSKGLLY